MTGAQLTAFRRGLRLTKETFAAKLQISVPTLRKHEAAAIVPRWLALACRAPVDEWADHGLPQRSIGYSRPRKRVRRERGADGRFAAKNAVETVSDPD
jgi:hypothetical protein